MKTKHTSGFTLVELLVVIAIIGLLSAFVIPTAHRGIEEARLAKCSANLRLLFSANTLYAADHKYYVPAAEDIWGFKGDQWRWHGWRQNRNSEFIPERGPLAEYLGQEKVIRNCPVFEGYRSNGQWDPSFEAGCGGYGYNQIGVGSRTYLAPGGMYDFQYKPWTKGMPPTAIQKPAETIMFADCAFIKYGRIIEYSFAEPVEEPTYGSKMKPSIHFRHNGKANVVWCDGHISQESMNGLSASLYREHQLGWFGEDEDNTFFDAY